ncbi:tetratricopeptide repeat protein [Roseivirga sp. E12]|uniref:tetratricopeptide repeat protein n=1 Tax=Roseivirga sp. E12 TaxID=2819237 RepID=UPI001ABC6336|nr:tetratricopeptide repeat protein [Roseivirga sp. E12]MBO3699634.1 tetratricopeptide repeat protein [Roseivirga sp. E12]
MKNLLVIGLIVCLCLSCGDQKSSETYDADSVQAVSLLGNDLTIPDRSEAQEKRLNDNLNEAQKNFDAEASEMNTIWLGRRHAYLYDYKKAIEVFTEGIAAYPNSYKLYRHRGHRYISIRQFDKAISDYEKAYELMPKDQMDIEPDGAPNRLNIPLSNTQFNILYHYGLAHYLKGNFEKAEAIYKKCMSYSDNPDLVVATSDWLYMALQRQGKSQIASELLGYIDPSMKIIENDSYFKRLMMYKGEIKPESLLEATGDDAALSLATQGYGVGNWYLYQNDTAKAKEIFQKVIEGTSWSAFGYIAAEVDLSKMN